MLDQRKLPSEAVYVTLTTAEATAEAIRGMVVRGAPAIGVTAGFAVAMAATSARSRTPAEFDAALERAREILAAARPTAVNLFWALDRMAGVARETAAGGASNDRIAEMPGARSARRSTTRTSRPAARSAATAHALVPDRATVLTHCNAGGARHRRLRHGARRDPRRRRAGKTVARAGRRDAPVPAGRAPHGVGADAGRHRHRRSSPTDMAGSLMRRREIDLVVVGADRIAANGDVANKIGTYTVAVLAKEHGIPFYVAAPLSTIDLATARTAMQIPIEERDPREVTADRRHADRARRRGRRATPPST